MRVLLKNQSGKQEHRLVYQVIDNELLIYSCRYHYDK
ncbi:MAG: type II toxin-antitoxin system YoeB family toxin [Bacteroidetes bacterium]|nr:type II toxin-antitoxin system YoeB family toxin [Bacteroidota bacterium]